MLTLMICGDLLKFARQMVFKANHPFSSQRFYVYLLKHAEEGINGRNEIQPTVCLHAESIDAMR